MTDRIDTPGNATSVELLGLMSRRSLLRSGALAGGLAVAGGMFGEAAARASGGSVTPAGKIFQITQTAEQLAVTLYSSGVENGLGLETTTSTTSRPRRSTSRSISASSPR